MKTHASISWKIIASVVLLSGAMGQNAFAQTQEYRGRACIIQTWSQCHSDWTVGTCFDTRFSPPNALGNGNNTRLSLFIGMYAMNYAQDGSAIGSTFRPARFSYVGSNGGVVDTAATQWRIPLVQPANYSLAYIHMLVDISKFSDFRPFATSDCVVRLRVTGLKTPETVPSSSGSQRISPVAAERNLPKLQDGLPK